MPCGVVHINDSVLASLGLGYPTKLIATRVLGSALVVTSLTPCSLSLHFAMRRLLVEQLYAVSQKNAPTLNGIARFLRHSVHVRQSVVI